MVCGEPDRLVDTSATNGLCAVITGMSAGVLIYLPKDRDPERFCHSGIIRS